MEQACHEAANKIRVGRTYWFSRVVGEAGLEPTTPGLEGRVLGRLQPGVA